MKTLKRTLAGFLAVLMLMSTVNLTAFAEAVRPEEPELSQEAAPEQPAPAEEKTAEPETAEEPEPGEAPEEPEAEGEALPAGDETAEPPVYKVVFRLTVTAAAEGEEAPESAVTEFARELAAGAAVTEPTAEELAILALPEGSRLDGWYLDPGYSQPADFAALKAEKNLVLYARAAAAEEPEEPAPEAAPIAQDYGIMPIFSWSPILTTTYEPVKDVYEVGDTIHVTFHVKNDRGTSMQHIMLGVSGSIDTSRMKYESSTRSYEEGEPYTWEEYTGKWGVGWQFNYERQWEDRRLKGLRDGETLTLTFSYEITENDINDSFSIVTKAANGLGDNDRNEQTLNTKVQKKQLNVTITGDKAELPYDGSYHEVRGFDYTVTGTDGKALDKDLVTVTYNKGTPSASGTDARTYQMGLERGNFTVTLNKADGKKYEIGTVTVNDGGLKINKQPITVTVEAAGSVHEGDSSVPVELDHVDGLVKDEHIADLAKDATGTVDTSRTGKQDITDVNGKLTITDGAGKDVTNNYEVTYTGAADVLPKDHTITYKLEEGSLAPSGKVLPGQQTVAWNDEVTVDTEYGTTVETGDDGFGNPTEAWTFDGWYLGRERVTTVTTGDKDITLTGRWTSKEIPETKYTGNVTVEYYYDGEQGEAPEGAPTELSGKFGETVKVEPKNPVTVNGVNYMLQAGENSIQVPKDNSGVIQVHYLTDANKDGTADKNQTVEITVTGKEVTKTYNGDTQTALEYTVTMSVDGSETKTWENGKEALAALKELGIELTVDETAKASGKNADTYDMNLTADTVKAIGESFNDVQVISEVGTLIIEKAELTVTAVNAAKTFGDPDPEFKYTVEGLKNGETEENVFGAGQISVARKGNDEAQGTYNDVLVPSSEVNPTNYTVKYVPGDFTINKKGFDSENPNGLTVEELKDVTYNGQSQAQKPVVKDGDKVLGLNKDYTLEYSGETTNVTEAGVTVTVKFQGNYNGSATVTYKINPAPIAVNDPENVTYDGEAHKWAPTVTGVGVTLIENKDYTVAYSKMDFTNVGEITVTITGMGNYTGTVTKSYQVEKCELNIYDKVSTEYTGLEQTARFGGGLNLADHQRNTLETRGHVLTATITGKNVGSYGMDKLQWSITDKDGNDVSGNYEMKAEGKGPRLIINPAQVTVTADDASKVYGDHDPEPFTATVTGMVNGESADELIKYTVTRDEGEDVGTHAITATGEEIQGNYKVTFVSGTLTITPAMLTVGTLENVPYDGAEHKQTPAVTGVGGVSLTENKDYTVAYSKTDFTNVGEITVMITGVGNYTGGATVSYQINPAQVTVTANSASKVYGDTDPEEFTATVEGLVGNDKINYSVTRMEGEDKGTYTITPAGEKNQGNYTVTYVPGTLTIDPAPAVVTVNPAAKVYGAADPALTAAVTGLVNNEPATLIDYALTREDGEDVGEYAVTAAGAAEQGNYTVTYVPGTLTIDPAPATVTVNPAAKVYGGADPALTAAVTGLVNNEPATLIDYTLARAAGENVGAYAITATGDAVQGNYAVTYVPANLTIDPAQVFVLADDAEKTAGEDDPVLTATVMGMVNNEPAGLINYNLIRTEGEDVGEYDIIAFGAAAQGNYTVTYVPATLTINPALAVINEDDTPLGNGPDGYTLTENNTVDISEDGTPLAGSPVENCCVLHLLLLLGALAVELFYTYDRKKRQQEEFQVRRNLA